MKDGWGQRMWVEIMRRRGGKYRQLFMSTVSPISSSATRRVSSSSSSSLRVPPGRARPIALPRSLPIRDRGRTSEAHEARLGASRPAPPASRAAPSADRALRRQPRSVERLRPKTTGLPAERCVAAARGRERRESGWRINDSHRCAGRVDLITMRADEQVTAG
jgi:hypothetical protein